MTSVELEQRAERAVRRGELLVALEHFEAYLAQQPDDERVRQRMESVRALLQPSELVSRRRTEPEEPEPGAGSLTDAEQGELHASSGRFDEAARAYAKAVEANPKNELLRERLEELKALAKPAGRADLGSAEKLEKADSGGFPKVAGRSARASEASFAPIPPRKADRPALLNELLDRIRVNRRKT
ncbi:MAG TPA: tetratricopeptide repeat protein [Myxococcales bacterium]|nr:tetratricopeptide repeat protein [Myxococcales bacterium]